jgi:uncharacterized protein (DUF305 family)
MRRRYFAVLLIGMLVTAGCGDRAAGGAPVAATSVPAASVARTAQANAIDVMFVQMALEYHRQAAELVDLTARRGSTQHVRDLASTIRRRSDTEADAMARWLTARGRPLAADPHAGAHAGHGDLHSLRPADVAPLRAASGRDVDRLALSLLLGHHHNTVAIARMELAKGGDDEARRLAEEIVRTRTAEVRQLLALVA